MKRLRSHPLIALLCALCLLGAQQVANAHFISHFETSGKTAAFQPSGNGDETPAAEGICVTCAAFAALSSAPPSHAPVLAATRTPNAPPAAAAYRFTPAPLAPPYASRAPPAVL
jgi:hypothetical protein